MQSKQEEIIHAFGQYSFGAPFIFAPDIQRRGPSGNIEPADVAWACNDTVILFYAYQSKTERSHREQGIRHNLNQAKRWLRLWRCGFTLLGKNESQSFSINYSDYKNKIIISVVDSIGYLPYQEAEFHFEKERELDVLLCVTLPVSAITQTARIGASLYDFLNILKMWRENSEELIKAETNILGLINGYHDLILRHIGYHDSIPKLEEDEDYQIVKKSMIALRASAIQKLNQQDASENKDIFNDIPLKDALTIMLNLKNIIAYARHNQQLNIVSGMSLDKYYFLLCSAHSVNLVEVGQQSNEVITENIINSHNAIINITCISEFEQPHIIHYSVPKGKSNTEELLESIQCS